jgi:tetratricopeptide (TPR) repeat protein
MTETTPGLVLALLRTAMNRGQNDVAAALGIAPSLLSDYERGRKVLGRERLEELVKAVGWAPEAIDRTVVWRAELPRAAPQGWEEDPEEELRRVVDLSLAALVEAARPVFTRAARQAQARRRRSEAAGLVKALRKRPEDEQRVLVEKDPAFHSWAVCEALCLASEKAAPASPRRALHLARLACTVAENARDAAGWRPRLLAWATGFLGNAWRVMGDLPVSLRAFEEVHRRLAEPAPGDPGLLDAGRLLDLEASLRRAQGLFPEALALLDQALDRAPDEAAAGRLWLKKSAVLEQAGDPAGALAALREAAGRIDGRREPRLLCVTRFNLAASLLRAGRPEEAAALLPEVRAAAVSRWDLVRLRWIEGRVLAARGHLERAAEALAEAHHAFRAEGIAYDAATSGLHLAEVLLRLGRTAAVRELARSAGLELAGQGAPEAARAAWSVFCQAVAQDTLTLELVRELVGRLAREPEPAGAAPH